MVTESVFRRRGLPVVLDTTEIAELDVKLHDIPEQTVERIGRSLKQETFAPGDRVVGAARVRHLAGFEVLFMLTMEDDKLVIWIGSIRPPNPADPMEVALQAIKAAATLRGASGM